MPPHSTTPTRASSRKPAPKRATSASRSPTGASPGSRGLAAPPSRPLEIIGWTEYVEFPEWGIPKLKAKIDTGARTSALHVDAVRRLDEGHVRFDVVLHRKKADRRVTVEAPILRLTRVRSSTGVYRRRYVVPARLRLGHVDKVIEVSLVSRDEMLFRMLLGRSAFSGDFLIDASRQCIQGMPHARRDRDGGGSARRAAEERSSDTTSAARRGSRKARRSAR